MPNPRVRSSGSRMTAELKLDHLAGRSSRKPMGEFVPEISKNLHRDSSIPVSPAAADKARLPSAALRPGSRHVSRCKSGASALSYSGSGQDLARETRH